MFNHTLGYSRANQAYQLILRKLCHVLAVYTHLLLVPC